MSKSLIFLVIFIASCSRNPDLAKTSPYNLNEYAISCISIDKETSVEEFLELSKLKECNFSIADYRRRESEIDSLENVFRSFRGESRAILIPILQECLSESTLDSLQQYSEPYTFRICTASEKTEFGSSERYTHFVIHDGVVIEVWSVVSGR